MKRVVILNGAAGSGKDTFARLCGQYCYALNRSTVSDIKKAAQLIGWDGLKNEKGRAFLSELKRISSEFYDFSYKNCKEEIHRFEQSDMFNVLFIHCREPEEISRLKNDFGVTTVLIKRAGVEPIESNYADRNVEKFEYDYVIHNDGTIVEFGETAYRFLKDICVL